MSGRISMGDSSPKEALERLRFDEKPPGVPVRVQRATVDELADTRGGDAQPTSDAGDA